SEQRQNFECRTDFTSRVDFVPIAPPSHFLPSAASSPVAPACWPQGKILPHPSARSALHSSPQDGGPKGKMIEGRRGDLGGALEENCGPHLTAVLLNRRIAGLSSEERRVGNGSESGLAHSLHTHRTH